MQREKICYVTGAMENLHKHHIFQGCRRNDSEKWGCWVWLRADYHNMSDHGVHFDKAFDARLKKECQQEFESLYGHEKFMEVFGKNYL